MSTGDNTKEALASAGNQERWTRFKEQSDEEDKRRADLLVASAKVFDVRELLERAGKIHEVDHPVLGKLRYGELTFEDSFKINDCKSDVEKTEMVAYLMLSKAYPDIPRDFLKRMPLVEAAALLDLLTRQPAFLSPLKSSQAGLRTVRRHKTLE